VVIEEVCARWRLKLGEVLGDKPTGTWAATRDGRAYVLKRFCAVDFPDLPYTLRFAAALRGQGWPASEPAEEPLAGAGETWVLFHRLPGQSVWEPGEQRARGRLLAELHFAAAATGITDRRAGFPVLEEVIADPELDRCLRTHEVARPDQGRMLRAGRDQAARRLAEHSAATAPRSVIHGDFAPWNLLFENGRLTGLVDFEATHHTYQVADFALSWRGYQDDVLRGYDEVRPLSEVEWQLIHPVYVAWLFLGVKEVLTDRSQAPDLTWQIAHLRKHSPLLAEKTGQ
jgi:Ser/Thr protein kinase RdoA (MazF antagonist)